MSKSLDSDRTRHFVWPDQGPNCLKRLSADDTSNGLLLCYSSKCLLLVIMLVIQPHMPGFFSFSPLRPN